MLEHFDSVVLEFAPYVFINAFLRNTKSFEFEFEHLLNLNCQPGNLKICPFELAGSAWTHHCLLNNAYFG